MPKPRITPQPKQRVREWQDSLTHDEQESEGPITREQARRELGHDWLPFNGTVGEDE